MDELLRRALISGLDIRAAPHAVWDGSRYRLWLSDSWVSDGGFADFQEVLPGEQFAETLSVEEAAALCKLHAQEIADNGMLDKLSAQEVLGCLGARAKRVEAIDGGFVWI